MLMDLLLQMSLLYGGAKTSTSSSSVGTFLLFRHRQYYCHYADTSNTSPVPSQWNDFHVFAPRRFWDGIEFRTKKVHQQLLMAISKFPSSCIPRSQPFFYFLPLQSMRGNSGFPGFANSHKIELKAHQYAAQILDSLEKLH